ncbi:MAG: hypothetical protein ACYDDA_02740 [Acidiferrobacteraceae bacterium]
MTERRESLTVIVVTTFCLLREWNGIISRIDLRGLIAAGTCARSTNCSPGSSAPSGP